MFLCRVLHTCNYFLLFFFITHLRDEPGDTKMKEIISVCKQLQFSGRNLRKQHKCVLWESSDYSCGAWGRRWGS